MSREAVFLDNESYPAINVQITSEELAYSQGGLYRLASVRTEDYFATIRFDLIIVIVFSHFTCRCTRVLTLSLDDLFCEPMDQFWHLEYLDNYKCCSGNNTISGYNDNNNSGSDAGLSVLTSQECLESSRVRDWSSWSSWSGCERLITVSGVENVRRRYRLSRSGQDEYLAG